MFALFLSAQPAAALAAQSGATAVSQPRPWSAASSELYAAPVVRPYEPPSDFGRQVAEGDADASVRTRPLTAPVAVEAYSDTYETRRSPRELSYQQGVEAARLRQNARMGPLDGEWRAVDGQGRSVLDLVLSDRGPTRPVEGALRINQNDRTALIDSVAAEGETRIITASVEDQPVILRLHRQGDGWSAEVAGLGRNQSLTLIRPETWAP